MKTAIGAAFAALTLAAALPALADQAPRTPAPSQSAQAEAQAGARPNQQAPGQRTMPGQGMMPGMGMQMDMNQMMSSCACCREAMQGKPAKAS